MSYTNKDLDNAITYSNNRYLLRLINKLYEKSPHLISHLKYSIQRADPETDYYFSDSFKNKAIKVDVVIPEKLCMKLSCNPIKGETTCTRKDEPSYYGIGDEANFQLRCQPSCFNLVDKPTVVEEGEEEEVQMVRLTYNNDYGCVILPTSSIWHENPFYRSSAVYEHRLNDLPAGFNQDTSDHSSFSQITYKYNKSYCDAFYDNWNEEKETCKPLWWERVLYAVVGEQITKLAKAGIISINSGFKSDYPPIDLPSPPDVEPEWKLFGWSHDIDESFILPSTDFEFSDTDITPLYREIKVECTPLSRNIHEENMRLIEKIKRNQGQISTDLRRKLESNYALVINGQELREVNKVKKHNTKARLQLRSLTNKEQEDMDIVDYMSAIIGGLFASIFTPDFWVDIGIGIVSDVILDEVKVIFRQLANDIIPKLTVKILEASGSVLTKVFANSIISTVTQTFSKIMIKTVSKVMIQLAKITAEIASVVGVILAILTIFDLLLSLWDPLGFNNKFDEEILRTVTSSSDVSLRQSLGVAIPKMTFSLMANMMLSPEEIIDQSLNCYKYIYEYLNSLDVNSEGSRIDKGPVMNIGDTNKEDVNNASIVNSKLVTPQELRDYEKNHASRMQFYRRPRNIVVGLAVIATLFMFIDIPFMSLLVFVVMVIVICIFYLNSSTINAENILDKIYKFSL